MASVTTPDIATNPNYYGLLFLNRLETPFLNFLGGMGGIRRNVQSEKFPMGVNYSTKTVGQPNYTKAQLRDASNFVTNSTQSQEYNVTQCFPYAIYLDDDARSQIDAISGINVAGAEKAVQNWLDAQAAVKMTEAARDIEYTFLNGSYQESNGTTATLSRGIITACTVNTVAAAGATLSTDLIDTLFKEMFDNGADFEDPVIYVNYFQKKKINALYGYAPTDRNIGGINIEQIETTLGRRVGVVLSANVPAATLLVADMAKCQPVGRQMPGKGNFYMEMMGKTGLAEKHVLTGWAGLDYTSATFHGTITGLATA